MAHRGPDEQTHWTSPSAELGFTRLSLVDPAAGRQPFVSEDGMVALIANGEVYNHRALERGLTNPVPMRTGSDCEVLLHLYNEHGGRRMLEQVNGMIAVIVVDLRRRKLTLARDRFGIKPLYFHRNARRIVAASEIKALFCDPETPRSVDWDGALGSPMFSQYPTVADVPNTTWFEGIESVAPGTVVEIDLQTGAMETTTWWDLPVEPDYTRSRAEFVADYRYLLREATHACATADAEVGLFLSGGIDSATVAAFARDVAPLHTFTAVNAGTYANGDVEAAHLVARELGLPNHPVYFDPQAAISPEEWMEFVWQMESPICSSPEAYFKYELHRAAREIRPDLKGMLLGAASDEFNGGYSVEFSRGNNWDDFDQMVRTQRLRGAQIADPRRSMWVDRGGAPWLTSQALGVTGDHYAAYLGAQWRNIWQYNVWLEDRTAAASGTEARVPFLDHRVVELAVSVPPELRPSLMWDKQLLREAMHGLLPKACTAREKMNAYYGPGTAGVYRTFLRMLQQDSAALVALALEQPTTGAFVEKDVVSRALLELNERPHSTDVELLLTIVNLGLLEAMTRNVPGPRVDMDKRPVAPEIVVSSWEDSQPDLDVLFGNGLEVLLESLCALAPNVQLVEDARSRGSYFVLVDAEIEYVIDDEAPAGWLEIVRDADGTRSLRELVLRAGGFASDLGEVIAEAVRARLFVFTKAQPTEDDTIPTDAVPVEIAASR